MQRSSIVATIAGLFVLSAFPAEAARKVSCTVRQEGNVVIREATLRLRKSPPFRLVQTRSLDLATNTETFVSSVRRGKTSVFELRLTKTDDGGTLAVSEIYGRGFRGIGQLDLAFAGGGAQMTVDGRGVTVQGVGTDAPSFTFVDGQPPPTLRAKRDVGRVLRKVAKLGTLECSSVEAGVRRDQINDPFKNECETCHFLCFLRGEACFAGKIVACALTPVGCGVAVVLEFFSTGLDCGEALVQCTDGCNAKGKECCREFCGDSCCGGNQRTRDDYLCVGATPDFAGQCCFPEDSCGSECCGFRATLTSAFRVVCKDPGRGLCCREEETACGDSCCAAGSRCDPVEGLCCKTDPCGDFCCPDGQRCRTPSDDFDLVDCIPCAADKTGPVCGDTCCGAGEVCGFGNTCCTSDKLCGGTCCEPQNCLNGTTCCQLPTGVPCGGNCCPSLTTQCCNGQCCAGECLGGAICCPRNRVCGNTCCPAGAACTDPNTGSCQACPGGQDACEYSPGTPTCCPTGSECCSNGQCCSGATPFCCDFGQGPFCGENCLR